MKIAKVMHLLPRLINSDHASVIKNLGNIKTLGFCYRESKKNGKFGRFSNFLMKINRKLRFNHILLV
jgi:hypothetical protein